MLRQGLRREFVFVICLICAISDATLIAAGVAGLGTVVARSEVALLIVTAAGAVFLFVYGLQAFIRAARPAGMSAREESAPRLSAAVATCLALTFLNPHVYLDTVVLVGSLSGRHEGAARLAFGIGAAAASFVWFFGLGYGARLIAPIFANPRAWRVLDTGIGIVMWSIAARLAAGLLG